MTPSSLKKIGQISTDKKGIDFMRCFLRMSDDRLPKKYLTWVPEGSRPTGRLRKRWIDGLTAGMSRRSRTLEEIERVRLYDDGDAWRAFWKSSS